MISPNYTFREGLEPAAYHVFNLDESSDIVHADCAGDMWEREFPLYEDDLEAARCLDDIYCPKCDRVIVSASEVVQ